MPLTRAFDNILRSYPVTRILHPWPAPRVDLFRAQTLSQAFLVRTVRGHNTSIPGKSH
jgi:hypothetical protein